MCTPRVSCPFARSPRGDLRVPAEGVWVGVGVVGVRVCVRWRARVDYNAEGGSVGEGTGAGGELRGARAPAAPAQRSS